MPTIDPAERELQEVRYVRALALCAAAFALLPALLAMMVKPSGSMYLGSQYNIDDHMVYASWMRQAMDGHLTFGNRFTTDQHPALLLNLYFLVLGWIAKVTGIAAAETLARTVFSFLCVPLLYRLIRRITPDVYTTKLALTLTVLGGGIGYLVWHNFGFAIVKPAPDGLNHLMLGLLPTDVWQPEGFVFSSMLTSSLFMASLCLILVAFNSVLDAMNPSWKNVGAGALAMLALMNMHSYDALLIAMVLVGFLAACLAKKLVTAPWLGRSALIAIGAVPSAAYFVYTLKNDPVFARHTEIITYAPNFRQSLFGYLPLIVMGVAALATYTRDPGKTKTNKRLAAGAAGLLLLVGLVAGQGQADYLAQNSLPGAYWVGIVGWVALYLLAFVPILLAADKEPAWNLVVAWAAIGIIAPYFPVAYQRKMEMMLAVPWAILAAVGIARLTNGLDRGVRNLTTVLAIVLICGSSVRWLQREVSLAKLNVSNTTVHPVSVSADAEHIIDFFNKQSGRVVVVAMPGVPHQMVDSAGQLLVDQYDTPYIPDLNPILTGFAGVVTYASHWNETPDYDKGEKRRNQATKIFLTKTTDTERKALIAKSQANFLVAPIPEAYPDFPLADLRPYGQTVWEGSQLRLIRVSK